MRKVQVSPQVLGVGNAISDDDDDDDDNYTSNRNRAAVSILRAAVALSVVIVTTVTVTRGTGDCTLLLAIVARPYHLRCFLHAKSKRSSIRPWQSVDAMY